ncbi:uncharacterized protein LOC135372681 [Ornithodoros turicata]|uniref:uncharacterized protein LOC135372681 n=1 Tax=Ornithodoros turicata TaxID=34597 RepID=UPI0031390C92
MKLERSSSTQELGTTCTPARALSDDEKLHFYAGFNGLERFKRFCSFVEAGYEDYKNACTESPSNRGRSRVFSVEEQLIIVLITLRVGLLERDLAFRYDVNLGYVSELCSFWTEFLSNYLEQTPIWPSRETVNDFMPEVFKESYPTTRIILDCTELFIETPSNLRVQSDTYSSYKSHNTAKGLIGIAPNGFVTFVSDLAPGRISVSLWLNRVDCINYLNQATVLWQTGDFLLLTTLLH